MPACRIASTLITLIQDRLDRIDTALQAMAYFYPPRLGGTLFGGID